MQRFRNIPEGHGETFDRNPKLGALSIGTWKCTTCVGIHFRVDEGRCFVAHINVVSNASHGTNIVTENGVEEVEDQVMRRLCGFMRKDRWPIHDRHFGRDLVVICPAFQFDFGYYNGLRIITVGRCIIGAIKKLFGYCAQELDYKRSKSKAKGTSTNLTTRANFLRDQSRNLRVDVNYHGFVINPRTNSIERLGAKDIFMPSQEDMVDYDPYDIEDSVEASEEGNCTFIATTDRPEAFQPSHRGDLYRSDSRAKEEARRLKRKHADVDAKLHEVFEHIKKPRPKLPDCAVM